MAQQSTIKDVLCPLIKFDTVSKNSNLGLIDWVCNYMSWPNISCQRIKGETPDKENVIFTVGALDQPPLLLSGHSDVVPVDGQTWEHNPFELTIDEGLWYGRGTTDMKGFVAVALTFMRNLSEDPPPFPIQLVISHDEEIGCVGVLSAIDALEQQREKPFLCIVGEPTNMTVVRQHKSKIVAQAKLQGKSGHSSNPESGLNAIDYGVDLYSELKVQQQINQQPERLDHQFEPSYSTVFCGRLSGGIILNIIPEHCVFDFEIRGLPQFNAEELIQPIVAKSKEINDLMQEKTESASCVIDIKSMTPGLSTAEDEPMLELCLNVLGQTQSYSVSYATEAGHFHAIGIPTLIIGPGGIENAHIADEFIDPKELTQCYDFLTNLVERLSNERS